MNLGVLVYRMMMRIQRCLRGSSRADGCILLPPRIPSEERGLLLMGRVV